MDELAARWQSALRGDTPPAAVPGEDADLDALLADADSAVDEFSDLEDPGEAARFNTSHFGVGSPKGGQFAPSSGGKGGTSAKKPAGKVVSPPVHGPAAAGGKTAAGGKAAQKRELHARAHADRVQARSLLKQLHALHAQMKASVAAHHKAAAAAKHTKAAAHAQAAHRKAAKHHHRKARSLHARIAALRTRIRGLLKQARALDAQAAKL